MLIGSIIDVLVTLTRNWYELSVKFHQKLNFCGETVNPTKFTIKATVGLVFSKILEKYTKIPQFYTTWKCFQWNFIKNTPSFTFKYHNTGKIQFSRVENLKSV